MKYSVTAANQQRPVIDLENINEKHGKVKFCPAVIKNSGIFRQNYSAGSSRYSLPSIHPYPPPSAHPTPSAHFPSLFRPLRFRPFPLGFPVWVSSGPNRVFRPRRRANPTENISTNPGRLSAPRFPLPSPSPIPSKTHNPQKGTKKAPIPQNRSFFRWWGKVDSNHRSRRQQIYSLPPLATREFPHETISCFLALPLELVDGLEPPTC